MTLAKILLTCFFCAIPASIVFAQDRLFENIYLFGSISTDNEKSEELYEEMKEYSRNNCGVSVLLRVPGDLSDQEEVNRSIMQANRIIEVFREATRTDVRVFITQLDDTPLKLLFMIYGDVYASDYGYKYLSPKDAERVRGNIFLLNASIKNIVRGDIEERYASRLDEAQEILKDTIKLRELTERISHTTLIQIQLLNGQLREGTDGGSELNEKAKEVTELKRQHIGFLEEIEDFRRQEVEWLRKIYIYESELKLFNCDFPFQEKFLSLRDVMELRELVTSKYKLDAVQEEMLGLYDIIAFLVKQSYGSAIYRLRNQ